MSPPRARPRMPSGSVRKPGATSQAAFPKACSSGVDKAASRPQPADGVTTVAADPARSRICNLLREVVRINVNKSKQMSINVSKFACIY
jgi:hypothetical protein